MLDDGSMITFGDRKRSAWRSFVLFKIEEEDGLARIRYESNHVWFKAMMTRTGSNFWGKKLRRNHHRVFMRKCKDFHPILAIIALILS